MPKIINHETRKRQILEQSLLIFAKKGFQNTNLSYIADVCKISRPTLYQYFKDKEQIFQFAIKHVTGDLFKEYKKISRDESLNYEGKLKAICRDVINKSYTNKPFIVSLVDFLFQMKRKGNDYSEEIKRRTVRLHYLFSVLINQGKRQGEFKDIPVAETVDQIFAMIESFAFQMVLLDSFVPENSAKLLELFVDSFTVEKS
ncbi:TetR/AcrR family transcriptional regulator [Spirochaeta isovalerica]|uniref:AcrR family transcriptional regulator n=1 Tax=Spirochaeta isovalerica TaxID=150 RepID=A0A841R6R7_9SPIO|nr:TetR/AcrR family transcriptional regulator [Spirochaeta isovalerica]MBB6479545.1 AcrR family transcriptional regulator [Spirochaeta isovalerica]